MAATIEEKIKSSQGVRKLFECEICHTLDTQASTPAPVRDTIRPPLLDAFVVQRNVQGAAVQISLPVVKRESGARADNLRRKAAAAPATVSE
jgi:hypothetical protein